MNSTILLGIKNDYESYKNIYQEILPTLKDRDNKAKVLLENSLYLSVYNTFEDFIKLMIENYINNISLKEIKFTELEEGIARKVFIENKGCIENILNANKESISQKAFSSYFKNLNNKISRETLQKYIHFDYLHKNKLNGYYKHLFKVLLGDEDFLKKVKLSEINEVFDDSLSQEVSIDASTFLADSTEKVRNRIAHANNKFEVKSYSSFSTFSKITDNFYKIILELAGQYYKHTRFALDKNVERNLLEDALESSD